MTSGQSEPDRKDVERVAGAIMGALNYGPLPKDMMDGGTFEGSVMRDQFMLTARAALSAMPHVSRVADLTMQRDMAFEKLDEYIDKTKEAERRAAELEKALAEVNGRVVASDTPIGPPAGSRLAVLQQDRNEWLELYSAPSGDRRETAEARITELEAKLAAAEARVKELEGRR